MIYETNFGCWEGYGTFKSPRSPPKQDERPIGSVLNGARGYDLSVKAGLKDTNPQQRHVTLHNILKAYHLKLLLSLQAAVGV